MEKEAHEALRVYITEILKKETATCGVVVTRRRNAMYVLWILHIYTYRLNSLRNDAKSKWREMLLPAKDTKDSGENLLFLEIRREFKKFLKEYSKILHRETTYNILWSGGWSDELILIAREWKDFDFLIRYYLYSLHEISHFPSLTTRCPSLPSSFSSSLTSSPSASLSFLDDSPSFSPLTSLPSDLPDTAASQNPSLYSRDNSLEALAVLQESKDPDLYYHYAADFIRKIPYETVSSWVSAGRLIDPVRLIPSLLQADTTHCPAGCEANRNLGVFFPHLLFELIDCGCFCWLFIPIICFFLSFRRKRKPNCSLFRVCVIFASKCSPDDFKSSFCISSPAKQ
jgi:hypothetical protein